MSEIDVKEVPEMRNDERNTLLLRAFAKCNNPLYSMNLAAYKPL